MLRASTQQFLEIQDIREGVLIMKDRSIRGVMMVSSQNFALQSEEEQEAIIYQFQSFLNSLDFSVQIIAQSRPLNITGYIDQLKEFAQAQGNALVRKQTTDYIAFIEGLIKEASIMSKHFFVVVPFALIEALPGEKQKGIQVPKVIGKLSDEEFERMKIQLWQRMEFVAIGLRRTGLQVVPLNTEELIELLWMRYHPLEAEKGYYPAVPPEMLK